jgi:hypothetical protein
MQGARYVRKVEAATRLVDVIAPRSWINTSQTDGLDPVKHTR